MDLPLREGELIAGKYAVERVLGEGGMGVVVAARHLELGERVALKFLLPEAAKLPEACVRFVREARAAARVKGEHVARVLDVGTAESGMPFIVMEYLEGRDLGRSIEARGPLAVTDAVHYVLQACEAVAQAHAIGIVHRDLKPANLFLTTSPDGSPLVKVLDFGISKATSVFSHTLSPDLTTVNASVGTPQYMSPEQARDAGKVDARTDVWGLGAILYELLVGKPAFDGDSIPAIVMMIATEEPAALEGSRGDVPVALAAVVRRCLQKNREERFANVAELARALEPFGPEEARGSVARVARILGHDSLPPPTTVDELPSGDARRPRAMLVALAAGVLASLFGVTVWSTRPSSAPVARTPVVRPPLEAPAILPQATESPATAKEAPRAEAPVASTKPPPAAKAPFSTRAFDETSAATQLFAATERAAQCAKPDAPSGSSRATITFAPNGTVSRVALSPPFAGSPNERCLRDVFAGVLVKPFDGAARSLEQRFRVLSPTEPGTLTFEANLPSEVALDGRPLGSTPKTLTVAPGAHTVLFVHPALGEKAHTVTLAPGQDKTVRATFEPRTPETR